MINKLTFQNSNLLLSTFPLIGARLVKDLLPSLQNTIRNGGARVKNSRLFLYRLIMTTRNITHTMTLSHGWLFLTETIVLALY